MHSKIEFQRAPESELARFDERSKVCTMNCGPHRDDPRSDKERKFLCDDCHELDGNDGSGCAL